MDAVSDGWIPQDWQIVASFVFAAVIIAGAVIKYFRDMKKEEPKPPAFDVKVLGAAFGEAQALQAIAEAAETIAQTVKEQRAIQDKESERGLQRWKDVVERLERIAAALEGSTGPPRRRA